MTVYDFIREKWPREAQRIISLTYAEDPRDAPIRLSNDVRVNCGWPNSVLASLFVWDTTPEGYEYWKGVAEGGGDKT